MCGQNKKVVIEGETQDDKGVVIPHEIAGKYLPQIVPGNGGDHVIVHDVNNVIPVYKIVLQRGEEGNEGEHQQKEDLPVEQTLLFEGSLLFGCHGQPILTCTSGVKSTLFSAGNIPGTF